jgi:hypothetical protein
MRQCNRSMRGEFSMDTEQPITLKESARLVELERKIETGMTTFVEVGNALMEIRDSRLYRVEYKTFEAYCRDKWGMSRRQADRLIGGSDVVENLRPRGLKTPTTEKQIRSLIKLPPAKQPEAWAKAVEIADGNQPTARQVEQAVQETISPEKPTRTRGSYDNWRTFRDICGQIASLCDSLDELKVDAAHAIQARDLSARLAAKLSKISKNQ